MSAKYGRERCKHDWVHRKDGYEEQCIGAICRKCGAFGCGCDVDWSMTTRKAFYARGVESTANIGGKWANPYVKKTKPAK